MDKNLKNIQVVVFGDDFWNTLGVIRSLGEAGIKPYFINYCKSKSWVKHSRYIKKYWQVDSLFEGLKVLKSISFECKASLICTSDLIMNFCDQNKESLISHYFISTVDFNGGFTKLMDKDIMLDIADKVNMLRPQSQSFEIKSEADIDYLYKSITVNYPCIIKPTTSLEGSKNDIHICQSKEEVKTSLSEIFKNKCFRIQIQDYIIKEKELLVCGCALPDGEVIIPGVLEKIRQYPVGIGATAFAKYIKPCESCIDIDAIVRYIKLIKFNGLFSIEYIQQKGKAYFLEINLRNDGNGYVPTVGKCNLPFYWVCNRTNIDVKIKKEIDKNYYVQSEFADFYWHKENASLIKWVTTFFKSKAHLYFSLKDPKPFIILFCNMLFSKLKKQFV